ncbi:MAG TPA: glutamate--tRNA ligase [Elusimicrobia bacterium]|nr:MAG: glutamate--tRNA ligase [Elusimicrobia bacterium GWA2_66_18]OGR72447.1 MAG: glutamate--tRNA ligase [Elusimicrobia bacterium GWC2_65_9]HAZ07077.1 glutamate--tRNA ligase [Elusimicrobiota bacterium]
MKVRTRFAPSPTGFLHIGGARTTLYSWLFARRHDGQFVLRIEDTDEVRSTDRSVTAILDSIKWLGLDWDEGPIDEKSDKGPYAPYYQMKRVDIYRKHLQQLVAAGKAYKCYCTKEELDEMRFLAQLEKRPPRYEGRCRRLTDSQRAAFEAAGKKFSYRFMMPTEGATIVDDRIRGKVSFENSLQQDLVIWKTTDGPTYNFCCVIDDHLMEITHVIRGDEHLSNTPSQIQMYEALGWTPPIFAHLSMILGPDGSKLSKRHGATSVLEFRDQGYLPRTMRNYLALLGWSTPESQQLFTDEDLIAKFDLAGCQKSPATFDTVKLQWMNGEYIRQTPVDELVTLAEPFLEKAGLKGLPGPDFKKTVALEREKFKLLSEIPSLVEFFYKPVVFTPKAMNKVLEVPGAKQVLLDLAEALKDFAPFEDKALEARIRKFCEEKVLKVGQVFHPLRAAVTGRTEGPTLFLMLEIMGRDMVVSRLKDAAAKLG